MVKKAAKKAQKKVAKKAANQASPAKKAGKSSISTRQVHDKAVAQVLNALLD